MNIENSYDYNRVFASELCFGIIELTYHWTKKLNFKLVGAVAYTDYISAEE